MESNLDEDGLCLRGLPCHRISTSGINLWKLYFVVLCLRYLVKLVDILEFELILFSFFLSSRHSAKHNMTLMFNSIETRERYEEDAVEHGNQIPSNEDHKSSEKVLYK